MLPLKGVIVLEFCQYLAGPSMGLRLADLGARVIKIEKPGAGDPSRRMSIKNLWADENSLLFHTINRNKESFAADLKNPEDLETVKSLIKKADVVTHSFRPGVMEKLGLDYTTVRRLNEKIIYLEISGYGKKGPWRNKPGQDLLLQSLSGLAYTSGNHQDGPVPIGISVVDVFCGVQGAQVILGALVRRQKTGIGAFLEISLFESAISMQFELLTTFYNQTGAMKRSSINNGSPLLGAPYGIYKTADGFIALAMMDLNMLQTAIGKSILNGYEIKDAFSHRDEIKKAIADELLTQSSDYWMDRLLSHHLWSSKVLNWQEMYSQKAYTDLQMEQWLKLKSGKQFLTTRSPIRLNQQVHNSHIPAPGLGDHTDIIKQDLLMQDL